MVFRFRVLGFWASWVSATVRDMEPGAFSRESACQGSGGWNGALCVFSGSGTHWALWKGYRQTNYKILLKGHETSIFAQSPKDAFRGFSGTVVSKIEVITAPSTKYDAEGIGGLINIITKKGFFRL